jgi:hypothetical protein
MRERKKREKEKEKKEKVSEEKICFAHTIFYYTKIRVLLRNLHRFVLILLLHDRKKLV